MNHSDIGHANHKHNNIVENVERSHSYKKVKSFQVVTSNALWGPGTMMIIVVDTNITFPAMVSFALLQCPAFSAVSKFIKFKKSTECLNRRVLWVRKTVQGARSRGLKWPQLSRIGFEWGIQPGWWAGRWRTRLRSLPKRSSSMLRGWNSCKRNQKTYLNWIWSTVRTQTDEKILYLTKYYQIAILFALLRIFSRKSLLSRANFCFSAFFLNFVQIHWILVLVMIYLSWVILQVMIYVFYFVLRGRCVSECIRRMILAWD